MAFAEAERLARPCVLLVRDGPAEGLAGVWGGPGLLTAPVGPYKHWLSIDCRFLPAGHGPSSGVLSVYTNEDDCESGAVVHDSTAILKTTTGTPLFAKRGRSLPPPDAMTDPDDPEYMRMWQGDCPLYTEAAAAVLGGWHFPWPDGDWEELRNQPLAVWTIADSEPWVEVWNTPNEFRVIQRIT